MAHRALRNPHKKRARSTPSPLRGEGWGEGSIRLRGGIPFTLYSLLLCHHITHERARVAHRALRNPHKKRARSTPSPLRGEGWGEGSIRLRGGIPFTLYSLLLCHHITHERARVAHRALRNPHKKRARSTPSPLWGEGWGEGAGVRETYGRGGHSVHFIFPATLSSHYQ